MSGVNNNCDVELIGEKLKQLSATGPKSFFAKDGQCAESKKRKLALNFGRLPGKQFLNMTS